MGISEGPSWESLQGMPELGIVESTVHSGFRPVGDERRIAQNKYYSLNQQDMDLLNPDGSVRVSAAEGGQWNFIRMDPGVSIVADIHDGKSTILVEMERYLTNLVYGRPVHHFELPAGGIEKDPKVTDFWDISKESILKAAHREFSEESGYQADDYILVGPQRGLMSHPGMSTHHNFTVLARGVRLRDDGPLPEATEIHGRKLIARWEDVHEMYMNQNGYASAHGPMKISSEGTVSSLNIAHRYLLRAQELGATVIDLGSHT